MNQVRARLRLLLLLIVLLQSGCTSTLRKWTAMDSSASSSSKKMEAVSQEEVLPPAESAQLAEATGEELEKKGFLLEATRYYEQARHLNPERDHLTRKLAVLYGRQGNFPRAHAEFEKARALTPNDAGLMNDIGYCHYQGGDLPEAEKWLRKAVELQSDHVRAHTNLAIVLAKQGKHQESLSTFLKVLPPPHAYCNIGVLLAQQGQEQQARQYLTHALSLNRNLQKAQFVLARLDGHGEQNPSAPSHIEQASGSRKLPGPAQ